jgi:hypothetical protein
MTTAPDGAPQGDAPAFDQWVLTPQEAAAELAKMQIVFSGPPPTHKPTTSLQARDRLAALGRNPEPLLKPLSSDFTQCQLGKLTISMRPLRLSYPRRSTASSRWPLPLRTPIQECT